MFGNWKGSKPGGDKKGKVHKIGTRMSDPILDSLKSYWDTLRAGRVAPFRSEIDPRQFEHALENMFILEIVGDNNIRVRLAGMKLCEMMGMEVRGMSPRAFMMPGDRTRFDEAVLEVVQKPTVTEFVMETIDYNGHSGTAYMLMMPLRSDFGEITRILGCITDTGDMYEAPVRMRMTQVNSEPIEMTASPEPARVAGFAEGKPAYRDQDGRPKLEAIRGGAEDAIRARKAPLTKKNRSHLRVIDND